MNKTEKMLLITTTSLLKQSKSIDYFSSLITVIAFLSFFTAIYFANNILLICGALSVSIGLIEKYYFIRVSFDKALFNNLIQMQSIEPLTEIDNALIVLKLSKKIDESRDLLDRLQGTIILFKKQLSCCVIQVLILLIACL